MEPKDINSLPKIVKNIQMSFVAGTVDNDVLESGNTPFHLKIVVEICGGPTCQFGCEDVGRLCQEFKRFLHTRLVKGGDCRINGLLVS